MRAVATIASSRPDAATIESRIISVHDAIASVRSIPARRAAWPPSTPGSAQVARPARTPPTSQPVAVIVSKATKTMVAVRAVSRPTSTRAPLDASEDGTPGQARRGEEHPEPDTSGQGGEDNGGHRHHPPAVPWADGSNPCAPTAAASSTVGGAAGMARPSGSGRHSSLETTWPPSTVPVTWRTLVI